MSLQIWFFLFEDRVNKAILLKTTLNVMWTSCWNWGQKNFSLYICCLFLRWMSCCNNGMLSAGISVIYLPAKWNVFLLLKHKCFFKSHVITSFFSIWTNTNNCLFDAWWFYLTFTLSETDHNENRNIGSKILYQS